jgi:hypothetical protein
MAASGTLYFPNGILLYLGSSISYKDYAGKYKRLVDWVKQTLSSAAYADSLYLTDGGYTSTTVTFDDATTGVRVIYNPVADDAVSANLYLVLPDNAGIFGRGAGSQRKINEWTDSQGKAHTIATLYDGGSIAEFSADRTRVVKGKFIIEAAGGGNFGISYKPNNLGAFYVDTYGTVQKPTAQQAYQGYGWYFDNGLVVPTGPDNAPASVSGHYCITF